MEHWDDTAVDLVEGAAHEDPVAKRKAAFVHGSFLNQAPLELLLQDVSLDVVSRRRCFNRGPKSVRLLNHIDAHFRTGELVALMSPSGAGKSTLLRILAERTAPGTHMEGTVLANGLHLSEDYRQLCAFLPQDDVMFGQLTVEEQISFQAAFRLPREVTKEQRQKRVRDILDRLSVTNCRSTEIGGPGFRKSVSGGERKRTSVASELVTNPMVLLLDEPVSGLDASTALALVQSLRNLAHREQRLVLCSIHQPSTEVFSLFDKVMLLARTGDGTGGNLAFFGTLPEAETFFANCGFPVPPQTNPASHYINVLTPVTQTQPDGSLLLLNEASIQHVVHAFDSWGRDALKTHIKIRSQTSFHELGQRFHKGGDDMAFHAPRPPRITLAREFVLLMWLHLLLLVRSPRTSYTRFAVATFLSLLAGVVFLQLNNTQSGLPNRQGALFYLISQTFMSGMMNVMPVLPTDRPVFLREHANRAYTGFSYWNAKSLIQCPYDVLLSFVFGVFAYFMIGLQPSRYGLFFLTLALLVNAGSSVAFAVSSSMRDMFTAMIVAPLIVTPMMLFSGFLTQTASIPVWLSWLCYLSPYYYAYPVLLSNELTGLNFYCTPSQLTPGGPNGTYFCPFPTGNSYLAYVGLSNVNVLWNLGMLAVLIVGYRLVGLITFMMVQDKDM